MHDKQKFCELKGSNILQLYAQEAWHMEAFIVGNKEGLLALRNAIDEALQSEKKQSVAHVSPTDLEGYEAHVIFVGDDEEEQLHRLQLPYTGKNAQTEIVFNDEEVNVNHPVKLLK